MKRLIFCLGLLLLFNLTVFCGEEESELLVKGYVYLKKDGKNLPIEGADVLVYYPIKEGSSGRGISTKAEGYFEVLLKKVLREKITIEASSPGKPGEDQYSRDYYVKKEIVLPQAGKEIEVKLVLEKCFFFVKVIGSDTGDALAGAEVGLNQLCKEKGHAILSGVGDDVPISNAEGIVKFRDYQRSDNLWVDLMHPEYAHKLYEIKETPWGKEKPIEIKLEKGVLVKIGAECEGKQLEDAYINICDETRYNQNLYHATKSEGRFMIRLPKGKYCLTAYHKQYVMIRKRIEILGSEGEKEIKVEMEKGKRVYGTIKFDDRPVANMPLAIIEVGKVYPDAIAGGPTCDEDGKYEVYLRPGKYKLYIAGIELATIEVKDEDIEKNINYKTE